jgi:hypothetical protein
MTLFLQVIEEMERIDNYLLLGMTFSAWYWCGNDVKKFKCQMSALIGIASWPCTFSIEQIPVLIGMIDFLLITEYVYITLNNVLYSL